MAGRIQNTIRNFLDSESSGGLLLIASAAAALLVANSQLSEAYFGALHAYLGPLSVQHWVNDALMAVFFLMVGLEIKREMVDGHLSSWPRRILPGAAAAAGMAVPALVYLAFNLNNGAAHGWAIPAATDIAFALGVISLLGPRVPTSLKVFLAALAIIDDLGAVIVIGLFYTTGVSLMDLGLAAAGVAALVALNLSGVKRLTPYLLLGLVLWFFTYRSGVHATIAGVLLALTIPIKRTPAKPEATVSESPLHLLEHSLIKPVSFIIVPIFGFANAGVSFSGLGMEAFFAPVTMGVAAGLAIGKLVGIFGAVLLLVKTGIVGLPAGASWPQMLGTTLLCGIGFTMSLFISLLAFDDVLLQNEAKIGILIGSLVAGLAGFIVLRFSKRADGRNFSQ
ncbi:Na+/H+ antiporter NhaA [Brucella anthropi]|uniref:Na(+)/H(+) antiporter NhaA 2 n=1 Tax=Brucella anthropi (strain ATCC 49188 / DSM 6882 / CCUG 24695 / JCM 21032 / LMG 3331 / NBRC 15819 / NCTC 12168 / Alc 37) TaxID=439375 RepID=NHAA2_BRUA4|nr:Na+/H+ antiporter NhaA [Brucella anthropi]A6X1P0.1 RecName: Full=Na(+)/H(+) antiporter NhaA 2; AltName: Full=Sodium/proton antiporter NhaA 2 [Brucella anthropi ATCC 49188]ABS15144.1 Na+/H+ antiporter NhaA [Brucella anthropi ATCC 49188]KAB2783008.1 Na+/H+ antiporter NhaA [Brucella anthropi]QQC24066.1 Na+/H+ antiporter NhaA [Brucella anthropi]SUA62196.1 Sodium/proton antiporter nhaA [Brucella anthropi]